MNARLLLILSLVLFMLTGALGLKMVEDCHRDSDGRLLRDSERIKCYHIAAMSEAYLNIRGSGWGTCLNIWNDFGSSDDDTRRKADLETNNCLYDVARITGNPDVCESIEKRVADPGTGLFGEAVSKDICIDEATRIQNLQPFYYYSDPDNTRLCSMIFILPFLVFCVVFSKK